MLNYPCIRLEINDFQRTWWKLPPASPCTFVPWASAEELWGKTGNCTYPEIGTKNQTFLENLKPAA